MSDTFTASNGVRVWIGTDSHSKQKCIFTEQGAHRFAYEPTRTDALREYFFAERDQELGRWRSKTHPKWIGYRLGGDLATLINEADGETIPIRRGNVFPISALLSELSDEFFAAHPDPKPWHTPKHLEIWALTIQGCPSEAYIYREGYPNREPAFRPVNNEDRVRFAPTDPKIVEAHRIWPES